MKIKAGHGISVSKVTGYRLDFLGFILDRTGFFSSLPHPDWLWDPPSFLSDGFSGLFFLALGALWP
jgi:hypothetical protein